MSGLDSAGHGTDETLNFDTIGMGSNEAISDDVAAVDQEQGNFAQNLATMLAYLTEAQEGMDCSKKDNEAARKRAEEDKERRKNERTIGQKADLETQRKIGGQAKGTPTRAPRGK